MRFSFFSNFFPACRKISRLEAYPYLMTIAKDHGVLRFTALARQIKAARALAGLEQSELAERVGVSRATISSWENGNTEPNATQFVRIARTTDVSVEWLAEAVEELVHPLGLEPRTHCFRVEPCFRVPDTVDELLGAWNLARSSDLR